MANIEEDEKAQQAGEEAKDAGCNHHSCLHFDEVEIKRIVQIVHDGLIVDQEDNGSEQLKNPEKRGNHPHYEEKHAHEDEQLGGLILARRISQQRERQNYDEGDEGHEHVVHLHSAQ